MPAPFLAATAPDPYTDDEQTAQNDSVQPSPQTDPESYGDCSPQLRSLGLESGLHGAPIDLSPLWTAKLGKAKRDSPETRELGEISAQDLLMIP